MKTYLNKSHFEEKLRGSTRKVIFYVTHIFTVKLKVLMHFFSIRGFEGDI